MPGLRRLHDRHAPGGTVLVAPYWPGAYAVLGERAPVWEIFALFPRPAWFERVEIARIEAAEPALALVLDWPLDGREALRFRHTHPLTYRYITEHYRPSGDGPGPRYQVFVRREAP